MVAKTVFGYWERSARRHQIQSAAAARAPEMTTGKGQIFSNTLFLKIAVRNDNQNKKDVLELCPRSFDVFLQVGFVVENPKPKQQGEQGLNMDRINEINDWFWNPV